jgi:AcrR family transcriptional regulator
MADLVAAMGIASASIYAAFGSKGALFREAVLLYEAEEGGFADVAFAEEPTARRAIDRTLREAVILYTRPGHPRGCMVVLSGTNTSSANEAVTRWLASHRKARTASLIARLERARAEGELPPDADVLALGDYFAIVLHGLSVQARDGVSRERLLASLPFALSVLPNRT